MSCGKWRVEGFGVGNETERLTDVEKGLSTESLMNAAGTLRSGTRPARSASAPSPARTTGAQMASSWCTTSQTRSPSIALPPG
eukprot:scaffold492_cov257-Pinguiococcus_pyrenoidosus.AAC.28